MSNIKREDARFSQDIDWGQLRFWQTVDPIPWWILDREKLERILEVQLDSRIEAKKLEIAQLEKIRDIVGRKTTAVK
ncbi:MAG: hypothetical protein ACM3UN_04805 [Bacillota bacterium]